jgi:hyperosmotically inducible protein
MKRALFAVAVVLLAGCSEQQVNQSGNALASAAPKLAGDGLVIAKIESKFVGIDPGSALHVAVASHDGAVKLTGKVKSDAVSQKFVAAAKDVEGVKNVDASLTVDASIPSAEQQVGDFSLMAAVRANLAGQAGVNALSVDVKAKNGVVTLAGKVKTAAIKSTLAAAAKSTSGVKSVVDQLTVAE